MRSAIAAHHLADPTDVGGGRVGLTHGRLPLGLCEVALDMRLHVQVTRVERVDGLVGTLEVSDDGRALEEHVVEAGLGQGAAGETLLRLQRVLEGVLEDFGGDVEIGLRFLGDIGAGSATEFLHERVVHGLRGGDHLGFPHGKLGLGDLAVSDGGVGVEQVAEAQKRKRVVVEARGETRGTRGVDVRTHDVADGLFGVVQLHRDDVDDLRLAVVDEVIFHVDGQRGEVGRVGEERGGHDLALGDRQFGLRAVRTGVRHAVFQVALDFLTTAIGGAAIEQGVEKHVRLEKHVDGLFDRVVVVGGGLDFADKRHGLLRVALNPVHALRELPES